METTLNKIPEWPKAPTTLEESGLDVDLVTELVLKRLHLAGSLSGLELASRLGVNFGVIEPSLDQLKWQHHVEISGVGVIGGPTYRYRITDAGRERAQLFLSQSRYAGTAPVPFQQYLDYMRAYQDAIQTRVDPAQVREAFRHLVLSPKMLDQLGPAVCSGHSLFVYGPPGNGKTAVSHAISALLSGNVAIPYAIEVEGSIIQVFDPVSHKPLESSEPASEAADRPGAMLYDHRWVPCERPNIVVGGNLGTESLDVTYSPISGFYRAPVQMRANGGLLVIDDFGRNRATPRDLLNRLIVPLENRSDYLSLQNGLKFEVPCEVFIVFATNLNPADLVDEAFQRRIPYKVLAADPTEEEFRQIFAAYCISANVATDDGVVDHLLEQRLRPAGIQMRGCQPRDLIEHGMAQAAYKSLPRRMTRELIDAACDVYFVDSRAAQRAN